MSQPGGFSSSDNPPTGAHPQPAIDPGAGASAEPARLPTLEGPGRSFLRGLLWLLIFALLMLLGLYGFRHMLGIQPANGTAPPAQVSEPREAVSNAAPPLQVTQDTQRIDTLNGGR